MVMERMAGIPIGQVDRLREAGVDIPRLARAGVEVFFTQVFRDGYFPRRHASRQHFRRHDPASHGKYIAVDFGIMGTLSERDQHYLAVNFLAFFRRDYQRWRPRIWSRLGAADTRMDDLEPEIRVVLEPAFDRPLSEISLGACCSRSSARRAGSASRSSRSSSCCRRRCSTSKASAAARSNLNLWVTAMPFLERWMEDRIGPPALKRRFLAEAPYIVAALPELPRLIHQRLTASPPVSDTVMRELTEGRADAESPPRR
jgi:ubiquinone biosynthesis protein